MKHEYAIFWKFGEMSVYFMEFFETLTTIKRTEMAKRTFLERISDLTRIAHRANFATVDKHISNLNFETRFSEMVSSRYTCRSFTDSKVNPAKITKILEIAHIAPSAHDRQPVHVWALTSDEAIARIREVHPTYDAPAVLMVGTNLSEAWVRSFDNKSSADTDAAVVIMHMILEASDLGLGVVWISDFDPARAAEKFPETAGYEITGLLAIGQPADNGEPYELHHKPKPFEEFCTVL